MEGGFLEEVDMEEDLKTAKAGPWQRCFNFGTCGDMKVLKKCAGKPLGCKLSSKFTSVFLNRHMQR